MLSASKANVRKEADLAALKEEKALIEKRLEQLGYDGDCAYEKAMVAFYNERLELCESLLQS